MVIGRVGLEGAMPSGWGYAAAEDKKGGTPTPPLLLHAAAEVLSAHLGHLPCQQGVLCTQSGRPPAGAKALEAPPGPTSHR